MTDPKDPNPDEMFTTVHHALLSMADQTPEGSAKALRLLEQGLQQVLPVSDRLSAMVWSAKLRILADLTEMAELPDEAVINNPSPWIALRRIEEAVHLDRDNGLAFFADSVNCAAFLDHELTAMWELRAEHIKSTQDLADAIAYLRSKQELLEHLSPYFPPRLAQSLGLFLIEASKISAAKEVLSAGLASPTIRFERNEEIRKAIEHNLGVIQAPQDPRLARSRGCSTSALAIASALGASAALFWIIASSL